MYPNSLLLASSNDNIWLSMACRTLSSSTGLNNATASGDIQKLVKGHKLGAMAHDDTSIVEEGSKTDTVAYHNLLWGCILLPNVFPSSFIKSIVSLIVLYSNFNVVSLVIFPPVDLYLNLMLVCHFELASTPSGLFPFLLHNSNRLALIFLSAGICSGKG